MDEIQELVNNPYETLTAEYKDWLDLSENVQRAKLARHVAALANTGGGRIIFGFRDTDLAPSGPNPFLKSLYSRDAIGSISRKYLDPSPECIVNIAVSSAGNEHVVITVPPHGAVPVCVKASGPEKNGKPEGVSVGTYYIRKVGPESAPILSPLEWQPVIRRCVLHDRNTLLGAINNVLTPQSPSATISDRLAKWHQAARSAYERALKESAVRDSILENSVHLSYLIATDNEERLPPDSLLEVARQVNYEMRDRVNTGWSIFFPFDRRPISPYFTSDGNIGDQEQFLEANLLLDADFSITDFWRLSGDGRATTIRAYRSDSWGMPGWDDRELFSLNVAAREVGELVRHAQAYSERFTTPLSISFRCEWTGLKGRSLSHPDRDWRPGQTSRTESVIGQGEWPSVQLLEDWPVVVATLVEPLVRAFSPTLRLGEGWVAREAETWRPIGNQYP
ncbi:AlbA family DNA-binding domain-containing protein [Sinorhizobium chiapasense]|uniref:ATP-binding protein n=1 Tax=Sinorhizobium chiapasense TaxID=501572 RepID=A0ABZ2BCJ6_9HYPH